MLVFLSFFFIVVPRATHRLFPATCGLKGHDSGLPLPIGQRRLFAYNNFLAQIWITDHSRAPPPFSFSPKPSDKGKKVR